MKSNYFSNFKKIHFIGIGGIGISALARFFIHHGIKITGSDQSASQLIEKLQQEGIPINIGHAAENISDDCDLIIITNAINEENIEFQAAEERSIPVMTYPQALGILTQEYKTIAITGTHGKTTTTAMSALALIANDADPNVIVGSTITQFDNRNQIIGASDIFLIEACEYKRSFLNYHPSIVVITNLEADHLDYFKDGNDYYKAFEELILNMKSDGLVIAYGEDENIKKLKRTHPNIRFVTYGNSFDCDYVLTNYHDLDLKIPGDHNKLNALAAIALTSELGLDVNLAVKSLNAFEGAARRFEFKGKLGNADVINDYAHHPTEIKALLQATREKYGQDSKVLCIFQPHQYSRTRLFFNEFPKSFELADRVIIPNIYAVRDSVEDMDALNVIKLVSNFNQHRPGLAFNGVNFEKTAEMVSEMAADFDVILTIGAGNITNLADQLIKPSSK